MAALGAVGHNASHDDLSMQMFIITPALGPLLYSISGVISDDTATPCERTVRAYRRTDGVLIGEAISDPVTGEYSIDCTSHEVHRIVVDDSAGTVYNDLIDRVIPA